MVEAEKIKKEVSSGKFSPVYLLMGEEPYYIDYLADFFEKEVLDEMEREFNLSVLYGNDVDLATIVSVARRFPMMGERNVVIVREAQHIRALTRKSGSEEEEADGAEDEKTSGALAPLLQYLQQPLAQTILVVCYKYKNLDKRSQVFKAFSKAGVVLSSPKIYDDKVPAWIHNYAGEKGYKIDPAASRLMADYLGNDLGKVVNELDKLMLNVPAGNMINLDHIQKFIGISKEYNVFELTNALDRKDMVKANRIVNHFAANPRDNSPIMVIAVLFSHFNKVLAYSALPDKSSATVKEKLGINPYFLKDYETAARNYPFAKLVFVMNLLREYDLKSKGFDSGDISGGELLRELIFKILH
jgi:DNA polymerase III subunit delta